MNRKQEISFRIISIIFLTSLILLYLLRAVYFFFHIDHPELLGVLS